MRADYDIPNHEELEQIMSFAETHNYPLYLLCRTLRKSGRRFGELYGVRKKVDDKFVWKYGVTPMDLDHTNNWFWTFILKKRRKDKGKSKGVYRKKLAFLDAETMSLLKGYIETRNIGPDQPIFRYKHYRSVQRDFKAIIDQLGIQKNITLHSFRAYFVTYCRRNGWSLSDIKKVTAHAKEATVAIYDRTEVLEIEKSARKLVDEI